MSEVLSRVDSCGMCGADYEVTVRRRSKDEELEYTRHLCQPTHILLWDFGTHRQARFVASSVTFPVYLTPDVPGMMNTIEEVRKLDRVAIKTLEAVYRVEVAEHASPFDVINIIGGYVQNEWYLAAKGAIPVSNQKNQEKRVADAKNPKAVKGNGGEAAEKTPRISKTYRIAAGKKEDAEKLKGQAAQVAGIVRVLGKADAKMIGQELVKLADFKTVQPPERVAGYYLKQLSDKGIFEEVPTQ